MAAKLSRLTHKIAIQLHLVAESSTVCSSLSRRPVWKLLDSPSSVKSFKSCTYCLSVVLVAVLCDCGQSL